MVYEYTAFIEADFGGPARISFSFRFVFSHKWAIKAMHMQLGTGRIINMHTHSVRNICY
jgi:hypothetical protein